MSITSELREEIGDIQNYRAGIEQQEKIVLDLGMIHATLAEHRERTVRHAGPTRSAVELDSHLARLLRRHESGRRPLESLGKLAEDPERLVRTLFGRWKATASEDEIAALARDDSPEPAEFLGVALEPLLEGGEVDFRSAEYAFPTVFIAYLRGNAAGDAVRAAYRRAVENPESSARVLRFLAALQAQASGTLSAGRENLNARLASHVATLEMADQQGVDPMTALEWQHPLVMLPVRLETRFVDENDDGKPDHLYVRVYPDQIQVDSHERALTEDELRWGEAFWAQLWFAGLPVPQDGAGGEGAARMYGDADNLPDERLRAVVAELYAQYGTDFSGAPAARFDEIRERLWVQGVERFGEEGAAHVVHALSPEYDGKNIGRILLGGWQGGAPSLDNAGNIVPLRFPDVDLRPGAWSQTPRARLLPDRWIVYAHYPATDGQERTTDWQSLDSGGQRRRIGKEYVLRVGGSAVQEPLGVGPSPESVARGGAGDEAMDWMIDFDKAVKVGMGLVIPLPEDWSADRGFSRLVVMGLRTSMDAETSAKALADLLDAAHYTHGLSLPGPGAATNNADEPAARASGRLAAESVDVELGAPLATAGSDGARLARFLGIPTEVFDHVAGADDSRDADARAMNAALWPATLGYFARNLWVDADAATMLGGGREGEGAPDALRWLETYRAHFVDYVRSAGPFKTLQVGKQPYGILPVSPLRVDDAAVATAPRDDDASGENGDGAGFEPGTLTLKDDDLFIPELLLRLWSLKDVWLDAAAGVPTVAGGDASLSRQRLLEMLAQEAVAHGYQRRMWLLENDHPIFEKLGLEPLREAQVQEVREALRTAGIHPARWNPRIAHLSFLGFSTIADELPIVDPGIGGFIEALVNDLTGGFFDGITVLRLKGATPLSSGAYQARSSLLRQLLRLAMLQAAIASRVRVGAVYGDHVHFPLEPGSYPIHPPPENFSGDTVFDLFHDEIATNAPARGPGQPLTDHPGLSAGDSYLDVIRQTASDVHAASPPDATPDPVLAGFLQSLQHLQNLDVQRLDRLTRETCDLASHRLDAWWTSTATRRLWQLRDRQAAGQGNRETTGGVYLGAFGLVENLSPGAGPDAEYLLAPSLDQATTATILRSAHKARAGGNGDDSSRAGSLAVNLSAARIQKALPLLEGVRRGLSLAELLGYRFERGLHQARLEKYIDEFRVLAPAVEGKLGKSDTTDDARKSNVVDGLTLHRKWQDDDLWNELPALDSNTEARNKINPIFQEFDAALDAVHDLLVAEGVHHLAHGRPERAAAALEALSRGGAPPIPQVIDTPRSETSVTHRLLLMFGDLDATAARANWKNWQPSYRRLIDPGDLPGADGGNGPSVTTGPGDPMTATAGMLRESPRPGPARGDLELPDLARLRGEQVRHRAEPALNVWADQLLPRPERIGCQGVFQWQARRAFAVGSFRTPAEPGTVTVDDLDFRPDVILFSVVVGASRTGDGAAKTTVAGWSHGVFRRALTGGFAAVQCATGASVDARGNAAYRATDQDAIAIEIADARGGKRIVARVIATHAGGFDLRFDPVEMTDGLVVTYQALQVADPTSVRVGQVRAPASADETVISLAGAGSAGQDDFDPDHVLFTTGIARAGNDGGAAGFSHGEVVRGDNGLTQRVVGYTLDPAGGNHRIGARDDAVVDLVAAGASAEVGLRASILDFPADDAGLRLRFSAPTGATYQQETITYVAMESPRSEAPGGERVHRPAIGHVVGPAGAGDTVTVDSLGFRPGLIEIFVAGALQTDGASSNPLPLTASPDSTAAGISHGMATGTVIQQGVCTGLTADGASALVSQNQVAAVLSRDDTGAPVARTTLRIASVTDAGFTLGFPELAETDHNLLIFFRAWPAQPAEQVFAVPTSVTMKDLRLTALDAIALTQNASEAGDSQLERRIGYHCFRHPPQNRPPVPRDAALQLSFQTLPDDPGVDVTVAEYIEAAGTIRDVIGDGRAADARDLVHPGEAMDRGHLPLQWKDPQQRDQVLDRGSAGRLAQRADQVQGELRKVGEILENRLQTLAAESNVCARVDGVVEALRRFQQSLPIRQIIDVVETLEDKHPGESTGDTENTLLAELRAVADHLRAGPTEPAGDVAAELLVEAGDSREMTIATDLPPGQQVAVTLGSHADAVRFPPRTVQARVQDDGAVTARFDFSPAVPGTAFTLVVEPSDDSGARLTETLIQRVNELQQRRREKLLQNLRDEGFLDTHRHQHQLADDYAQLSPELQQHFWAALPKRGKRYALAWMGHEELAERYEHIDLTLNQAVLRSIREVEESAQREILARLDDAGELDRLQRQLMGNYPNLDPEQRRHLWASLSTPAKFLVLDQLGRDDLAARFRDTPARPTVTNGRVVDAPEGGAWRDLERYIAEELTYLPALLWLARIRPELEGGAGNRLEEAIKAANRANTVGDEVQLMRTVVEALTTSGHPQQAFTQADFDAARAIRDLLSLDMDDMLETLDRLLQPLDWSGLSRLLAVTGDRRQPADQRIWRSRAADVHGVVPKHAEAEVRARLERLLAFPRLENVPRELGAYSVPFRDFLMDGDVDLEFVVALEQFLADPAATSRALAGVIQAPHRVVQSLHDFIHHADTLGQDETAADLLEDFIGAVDNGDIAAGDLGQIVEHPQVLLRVVKYHAEHLREIVRESLRAAPNTGNQSGEFLQDYATWLGNMKTRADQGLRQRILGALEHPDPAASFRAGVLESLRQGLLRASYFGIYGSTPASAAGGSLADEQTLVAQGKIVRDEVQRRHREAAHLAPGSPGDGSASVESQIQRLRALLGKAFTVLPPFVPVNPGEIHATLAASDRLLGEDRYAPDTWLQRIARIRDRPATFQQARTYADGFALSSPDGSGDQHSIRRHLSVGQLANQSDHWLGRDGIRPGGGEVVFGIDFVTRHEADPPLPPTPAQSHQPVAGLFIDEWVESVPAGKETIGVGLHYNDPGARAPQSLLLAVPPAWKLSDNNANELDHQWQHVGATYWSVPALLQCIEETVDLTRIRPVDLEALQKLGHVLPALCFPHNRKTGDGSTPPLPDAPSVDFDVFDWRWQR